MRTGTESPAVISARTNLEAAIRSGASVDEAVALREELDDLLDRERDAMEKSVRRAQLMGDIQRRQNDVKREKGNADLAAVDAKMFSDHAPVVTIEYAGRSVRIKLASAEPHSPLLAAEALKRIAQAVGQAFQLARGNARTAGRVVRPQWDTMDLRDWIRQAVSQGLVEFPSNGKIK